MKVIVCITLLLALVQLGVVVGLRPQRDCSLVDCVPVRCPGAYTPKGQCCQECPNCAATLCMKPNCPMPVTPPGECCPKCPGTTCQYRGRVFKDGQSYKDDCNTCTCIDGAFSCTEMMCVTGCHYKGRMIKNGQSFKEDCNTCTCVNGVIECTEKACGSECEYKRQWYKNGQTFKDQCNDCTCFNGIAGCTKKACPKTCTVNGNTYRVGQNFADDCNVCTCRDDGRVICTMMDCSVNNPCATVRCAQPACSNPVIPPDQCCGVCDQGCNVNGTIYNDGDRIRDCDKPCSICVCNAGSVKAFPKYCARPRCRYPIILAGKCCPQCPKDSYQ